MAKANWVKVNPASGSGDATVNVSSTNEHTGRKSRTSTLTWKAANVTDVVRTVAQAGKPEYVDIDDAAAADKGGKVVTIYGISNSTKLTFSLGSGDLTTISLPANYTANSVTTRNGAEISGDPGAISAFPFSITITVPNNENLSAVTRQIIVEDAAGNRDVCVLKQAAGEAFIIIAEGDIELDYKGTPVSVFVDSNTNWTIE